MELLAILAPHESMLSFVVTMVTVVTTGYHDDCGYHGDCGYHRNWFQHVNDTINFEYNVGCDDSREKYNFIIALE